MSNPNKPKIESLELNKETLQELTEPQAEQARGGVLDGEVKGSRASCNADTCGGCPCTRGSGDCKP